MSATVGLGDVQSAAIRSLASQRSFGKAGLAVNSTTNTYTLTVGTKQTDDIITVTASVNGATAVVATYTVLVGNADEAAVATALEVQIEALTGIASSATGAVITITPTTTTDAIVISAAVTKAVGSPTTTATVSETVLGSKGFKTANTFQCSIDGHCGEQTTQTNLALTGSRIPVSSFKWYLVTMNTSGTIVATPGTNGLNVLPDIPASQAVVGAIKIATNASVTFMPGTTSLNLTGITDTYYDLSVVPAAGYPV